MNFFKKLISEKDKSENVVEAHLKSASGPVLKVVMNDLHLATVFSDGARFGIIYHKDFIGSGIAPFNPEQLKMRDVPEVDRCYYSDNLWHSFASRIPSSERPDYKLLISRLGLTGGENPLVILAKIGSVSISRPWKLELVKSS